MAVAIILQRTSYAEIILDDYSGTDSEYADMVRTAVNAVEEGDIYEKGHWAITRVRKISIKTKSEVNHNDKSRTN